MNSSERDPGTKGERTRGSAKKESVPKTVSFRIDHATASALVERATSYGVSSHELARNYVETILAEGEERAQILVVLERMYSQLERMHSQLEKLQGDVETGFIAILVSSGAATEEEARKWAKENL